MLTIDLSGKSALVLGGSRGIGAGITETFCRAGAVTAFTHTGNPENRERIMEFLQGIEEAGGEVHPYEADALSSLRTKEVVRSVVEKTGGLDILVCNVGRNLARVPEKIGDESWREYLDINLTSSFYAVREALGPMLRQGRGKIILIGSSAVYDGGGGAIDYAAAKAGLSGMMSYLCRTYAKKGVLTNLIHPCVIETDLLRERYRSEEKRNTLLEQIPVGRLGTPEDIAGLAVFLASGWGDYICGQEILADGGRTFFSR